MRTLPRKCTAPHARAGVVTATHQRSCEEGAPELAWKDRRDSVRLRGTAELSAMSFTVCRHFQFAKRTSSKAVLSPQSSYLYFTYWARLVCTTTTLTSPGLARKHPQVNALTAELLISPFTRDPLLGSLVCGTAPPSSPGLLAAPTAPHPTPAAARPVIGPETRCRALSSLQCCSHKSAKTP